jgi:hypothetical protein
VQVLSANASLTYLDARKVPRFSELYTALAELLLQPGGTCRLGFLRCDAFDVSPCTKPTHTPSPVHRTPIHTRARPSLADAHPRPSTARRHILAPSPTPDPTPSAAPQLRERERHQSHLCCSCFTPRLFTPPLRRCSSTRVSFTPRLFTPPLRRSSRTRVSSSHLVYSHLVYSHLPFAGARARERPLAA